MKHNLPDSSKHVVVLNIFLTKTLQQQTLLSDDWF